MFKTFSDFAHLPPSQHPGQPVHCDHGFDVWSKSGKLYVILADGTQQPVPSIAEAQKTIAPILAKQRQADAAIAAEKARLAADEAAAASASTAAARAVETPALAPAATPSESAMS